MCNKLWNGIVFYCSRIFLTPQFFDRMRLKKKVDFLTDELLHIVFPDFKGIIRSISAWSLTFWLMSLHISLLFPSPGMGGFWGAVPALESRCNQAKCRGVLGNVSTVVHTLYQSVAVVHQFIVSKPFINTKKKKCAVRLSCMLTVFLMKISKRYRQGREWSR